MLAWTGLAVLEGGGRKNFSPRPDGRSYANHILTQSRDALSEADLGLYCKGERYCRVRARRLHRLVGRVPSRGEPCIGYSCKQTLARQGLNSRRRIGAFEG